MAFVVEHDLNAEDYPDTSDDTKIMNCRMCKYSISNSYKYPDKCIKNDFLLDDMDRTVCDNFEGNDTYKKKKKCGFRYVK